MVNVAQVSDEAPLLLCSSAPLLCREFRLNERDIQVDILTGGAGNDRFILGDNNEVYYLGSGTSFNDVAIIGTEKPAGGYTGDFNIGDVIQLQKGFIYELEESGTNTFMGATRFCENQCDR